MDTGNHWQLIFNDPNFSGPPLLLDSATTIMPSNTTTGQAGHFKLYKTYNGGATWKLDTTNMTLGGGSTDGDSALVIHSFQNGAVSTDNGMTWKPLGFGGMTVVSTSKTIDKKNFYVRGHSNFGTNYLISTNFGYDNFQVKSSGNQQPVPITNWGLEVISHNEIYSCGRAIYDSLSKGTISKTTNQGQTWEIYNTGLNHTLLCILALNDSLFIVSGDSGVLFLWNKYNSPNAIDTWQTEAHDITMYPNPSSAYLNIEFALKEHLKESLALKY